MKTINNVVAWSVPYPGWIKINSDAAVPRSGSAGFGMVCRDNRGKLLHATLRRSQNNLCVLLSELWAARWALKLARERVFHAIIISGYNLSA